jgi:D-3-phosphoglycerate dehydrogenase
MKKEHHILIIDEVHPALLDVLHNYHVVYLPHVLESDLAQELAQASILIVRSKLTLSAEWLDLAPQLALIGRLGSGMDNIDLDCAEQKGITCVNAPEGNRNAVAEQTMAMMLSLLANVNKASLEVKNGVWDRNANQGEELAGKCVGIIGYGNVGKTLATKLGSFGCRIMAYDKYISGFAAGHVEEVSLATLQEQADIVSLHVPLNEFSIKMIDKRFISEMKKQFYLLNLSRGQVCVLQEIILGLESKKIKGVALDVLPNEKIETMNKNEQLEFSYLSNSENVIITPHIGGLTNESFKQLALVLGEKIEMWLQKHPFINPK